MLYLEDYLEMIEHLPQELRDRFTDMREMDLGIHNNMDELEKRVKTFFNDCRRFQNEDLPSNLEQEFEGIRTEYYKTLEDADEKVHLANTMYDLVDKYLRRLDSELHKFKCELEADNKGITEVLEKRSLEMDTPTPVTNLSQKENRFDSVNSNSYSSRYARPRSERRRDSNSSLSSQFAEKRQNMQQASNSSLATASAVTAAPLIEPTRLATSSIPQSSVPSNSASAAGISYGLGHGLGAGTAIAAAASQAIAATQQMQQGRRTASLKASYEAINTSGHEFRELAGAAQTAIQAIQQDSANNRKKQNKKYSSTATSTLQQIVPAQVPQPLVQEVPTVEMDAAATEVTEGEWTYDPNEPRYCLCNQVSYGDMVACDNEECPSEWFHYPCVGISAPPKGKWYCPQCTTTMKRRGGRKN
ncbi:unnamed protein product [Ceutorhynchus assimilis]|uniref:Inhibitor of growth protein n=1 Tax=Ceutorhynchus assimilis TaxID=467358 RepID=A0A9N9QQE3_9CUCU|nr:unnamed protein product [Ceutorhynchus assimilis]